MRSAVVAVVDLRVVLFTTADLCLLAFAFCVPTHAQVHCSTGSERARSISSPYVHVHIFSFGLKTTTAARQVRPREHLRSLELKEDVKHPSAQERKPQRFICPFRLSPSSHIKRFPQTLVIFCLFVLIHPSVTPSATNQALTAKQPLCLLIVTSKGPVSLALRRAIAAIHLSPP